MMAKMSKVILTLLVVLGITQVSWTKTPFFYESEFDAGEKESTTQAPDDVLASIFGRNKDGICLLAWVHVNITVNYNNIHDELVSKSIVYPPGTTDETLKAVCLGEKIGSQDGPAIEFGWVWPAAPGTNEEHAKNTLLFIFSQDDQQATLTNVKAHIETKDAQFIDSDGEPVDVEVDFNLPADLNRSYKCKLDSVDMPREEVDAGIIELREIRFELGTNLSSVFDDGSTCGASGNHVAMISILLGLLVTYIRWLL